MKQLERYRVKPKEHFDLSAHETEPAKSERLSDQELFERTQKLGERLDHLQGLLYAAKQRGVLLVLQGMDTAGKDGSIRHVFSHISPLGVRAEAFGAPSAEELSHDFLWRVHLKTPRLGEIVVFNRSHYEDVLVTRVKGLISRETCEARLQDIKAFENLLHNQGVQVIKCFLNISKSEQKKRLQERLADPHKRWKLQPSDFEDRKLWGQFQQAYQDAISASSTHESPWYVIPADSKHYRDYCLTGLLVHTLEGMDLQVPRVKYDFSSTVLD
jgi:PPK2 family polyphosphate:nucleotide phosphotransferase